MTLLLLESFDETDTVADLTQGAKWDSLGTSGASIISGRTGSALRYVGNTGNTFQRTFSSDGHATYVVGSMLYLNGLNRDDSIILQFNEGATNHITMRHLNASGQEALAFYRANSTLLLQTNTLSQGVAYYMEVKVVVHDTTGSIEIRLDGALFASITNADTRNAGTGVIDRIVFSHPANNGTDGETRWDDIYVLNGAGSAPNNDFIGDIRVECLFPNGNGNSSQFDGSDGNSTDNYLLVDETDPDDDTTYVESATIGDKDTYAFGNMSAPSTSTVYGVQPNLRARKTDAGLRQVVTVARLSGTEVDGSAHTLGLQTWRYLASVYETKPGGGVWTVTDVDSAEFGVKVSA